MPWTTLTTTLTTTTRTHTHTRTHTPGALDLRDCKLFCLDDTDEMLSLGFKGHIYDISRFLPPEKVQYCLSTEIVDADVLDVANNLMRKPVLIKRHELSLGGIKQFYIDSEHQEWKLDILRDLYETLTITQCVICCNTEAKVKWLKSKLEGEGRTVCVIFDGMSHTQCESALRHYRDGSVRFLITTFGRRPLRVELPQISFTILYDLPRVREHYLECIGRSSRFGRKGVAVIFRVCGEERFIRDLERYYNTCIEEMPLNIVDLI